jgi:hypothetical protein
MSTYSLSPTVDAFEAALTSLHPLADHHDRMLAAHYKATNHTLTATQIAKAVSYADFHAVNLHYGKLAVLICDKLGVSPDFGVMLESAEPNEDNGHLELVMRTELASALRNLGWYGR